MAIEEEVWHPPTEPWWKSSSSADRLYSIVTSTWGLTFLFVGITLLVYYFTAYHYEGGKVPLVDAFLDGPSQSPHNHPVRLADAFLHGRLDVANGKDLTGFLDFACQPYPCADGSKYYPLEPPGTALVILPGVALFGLSINQTLVSVVIGAITAGVVYQVSRRLTDNVWHQLWLTAMFVFGTVYWWNAVYVGVWYFNHTVAVLFLFAAVYETLAGKRPFTAGIFLGAAYITRLPTVWTFPFFVIMFTDFGKLRETFLGLQRVAVAVAVGAAVAVAAAVAVGLAVGLATGAALAVVVGVGVVVSVAVATGAGVGVAVAVMGRDSQWWAELRASLSQLIRISRPIVTFGAGLAIFVVGFAVLNYVRFDTVSPQATYDHWHAKASLSAPGGMLEHGLVSVKHIKRHAPIFFEKPLYMFPKSDDFKFWESDRPYIWPSWNGAAFWATTPAFLLAFLAAINKRWLRIAGGLVIALALVVLFIIPNLGRGPESQPWFDWAQWDIPRLVKLLPFFVLTGLSIFFAIRNQNKLVVACWAAVIPVIFVHHLAASTGWPQFGYRYLLDYAPFAFLLTWEGMGRRLTWYGMALIALGIFINACGVLWTNKFDTSGVGGFRWTSW